MMPLGQANDLPEKDLHLLERALAALERTAGITGEIVATEPEHEGVGARPDATVEINAGGAHYRYQVEVRRVDRFAAIGQIKNQIDCFGQPGMLVAPRITADTADKCRELDVQFIDGNGNAFLHAPGLYLLVKGQRPQEDDFGAIDALPRGATAAALRAVFALLCKPELMNAPYRELTEAAGIALGAIGPVFDDLNNRGYTTGGKKKGERRLLERKRLINEWVTNYPIKLRPKLNPKRFRAPVQNWWQNIDIANYGAQWGGELAADKLTNYLRPTTVTIYMRPGAARQNLAKLVAENKLRGAPDGEVEILETFWNFPPDPQAPEIVPPLLVYADLLASMDPRDFEVARLIHDQKIHATDPTT